jgi:hypothetical protein
MKDAMEKLTLHGPANYEIRVPGEVDLCTAEWAMGMVINHECDGDAPPVTTLTGAFDQAALHGLLRRLYSLGLPLISVDCLDWEMRA